MWELQTPWYELCIRATVIFVFVFFVLRIWGKKHFGELATFDFILLLIVSESLQSALTPDENSLTGAMISFTTLVFLNSVLNRIAFHSKKAEEFIEGKAEILIKNGKVNRELMRKETITEEELLEALRERGVLTPDDVQQATLESDGTITVVKRRDLLTIPRKRTQS